jgi:hypothetical protein
MLQTGNHRRFPQEAFEEGRVERETRRQRFNGDKAPERRLEAFVDGRHTALAQSLDDLILAD